MNLRLKVALIQKGVPAYRLAMEADINPNRVSKFISGLSAPTDEEMKRLSEVLGKPISQLFPTEISTPFEVA